MVRPKFTYGALVWAYSIRSKRLILKLRRLNRLSISTYAKVHRSSPSRALEIITDTIPLHIYLQKEAVRAYVRLQNTLTLTCAGLDRRNPSIRSHLLKLQHPVLDHRIYAVMANSFVCNAMRPECIFQVQTLTLRHREAYEDFSNETCRIY